MNKITFAILGMAHIHNGTPLFYDAFNESGLYVAALRFPDAVYHPQAPQKHNVSSAELIPWVLCQCQDLTQATELLSATNLLPTPVHPSLPVTPLHWLVADRSGCLTVESVADGLRVYPNPYGVLTNAPSFPEQLYRIQQAPTIPLSDIRAQYSSTGRFLRAVHAKETAAPAQNGTDATLRFLHLLDTVSIPLGMTTGEGGAPMGTLYASCADAQNGRYHFVFPPQREIRSLSFSQAEGKELITIHISAPPPCTNRSDRSAHPDPHR